MITTYEDQGCRVAASCLSCPLSRCVFEHPRGPRAGLAADRDQQIVVLHRAGVSAGTLARRFGLSRRHIFRITNREGDAA